ncbi:UNVERIFIED_CONTAM: Trans-alpha-bergamotene synthase [Sesamum angustifolium]|uniref:Trans-alpha-bergamotene synthase n=1 Tax=Sesamum angustifolium TaxID=2727405 RepID=A0AAW2PAK5_9LAMI
MQAKAFIEEDGNFMECLADDVKGILSLYEASFLSLEGMPWSFHYTGECRNLKPMVYRWYKETGLPEKLRFARHRLAECFLWALGFTPEPHFGYARKILTKIAVLITIMDDIYDVYGTLDELEVFTQTIERDQDFNIISNLRKLWAELSRAYYLEATWYHSGYFPSTEEYLNTAWVSISGPVLLFHAYFCITNPINKGELQSLEKYPGLFIGHRWFFV